MEGENIQSIPMVSQFLMSGDMLGHFRDIQKKFGLAEDRAIEYATLVFAVLSGDIKCEHMPEMIAEAFGVEAVKAQQIAVEVVGYGLLPLEHYLPGISEQIVAWGGKIEDYPAERVGKEKITADRFAGNLTENLELTLSPVHIKRLGFLTKSYFAGEKTRDATLTFFARPVNIGGLGLPLEEAKNLMENIDESKEMIELVDDVKDETFQEESEEAVELSSIDDLRPTLSVGGEEETVKAIVAPVIEEKEVKSEVVEEKKEEKVEEKIEVPVTANLPEVAPSMEVSTTTPVTPRVMVAGGEFTSDQQDIDKQAQVIAKKDIASEGNDEKLKAAVEMVLAAASTLLQAKRLAKKEFAPVATMMIRGVRDAMQTRGVLVKEFGLDEASIDVLIEFINSGSKFYHETRVELSSIGGLRPKLSFGGSEDKTMDKKPTAAEVMDQRFAEVTKTLPKAPITPVLDEARVSAARSKEDEVAGQAAKIDLAKLEVAAEAAKPVVAKAMLTVGSVPPSLPGEQVMMNDVKFRPRLVGPVDELGTMMPTDFRRLSSDPVEATKKIEDLLAALQTTSYEERIRGIQAWRVSPVCRLYAAMAGEALQLGVALAEVASKRRNKGEESLSPAEMKAIGALNAKMRF